MGSPKKELGKTVHPLVLKHMWYGLSGVLGDEKAKVGPIYDEVEEGFRECFREQTQIGWEHLVYGRVSIKWTEVNKNLMKRDSRLVQDKHVVAKKMI